MLRVQVPNKLFAWEVRHLAPVLTLDGLHDIPHLLVSGFNKPSLLLLMVDDPDGVHRVATVVAILDDREIETTLGLHFIIYKDFFEIQDLKF